ncbi:partial Vitamin B12 transport ATP-binding protein BacA, partial [Patescibacteria group bacterium]
AEDCRIATESAIALGHSLFYCCLLLISFTEILWSLSGVVTVNFGFTFNLHGHLVWIAIVYAGLASWLGWYIGLPLTRATNANQTAEANFRSGLIDARENTQAIALIEAENFEKRRFKKLFNQVREIWAQQTTAWQYILAFSTGYGLLSMAFPVLISSPRYILGTITLGALMQSAQAFQHMASALSWPVDNLAGIASWRASVERILSLLKDLDEVDDEIAKPEHHWIVVEQTNKPILAFRDLSISKFNGPVLVSGINMEIHQGDHVQITGNTFTGAKLFRAIAGLRPWGTGKIELPNNDHLFFMPPRPHLPANIPLRDAICYPNYPDNFDMNELKRIMEMVELEHLIEQLDQVDIWSHSLSREEQQRLGVVRLLLNKPLWIFIQEAFDSLDEESEQQMLRLIYQQLPSATILSITSLPYAHKFHKKFLEL